MTGDVREGTLEQVELDPLVYQALHTGTLGDVAFYCDLVRKCAALHKDLNQSESKPWVLELGCGGGRLSVKLWEAGSRVIGVDYHQGLLRLAQAHFERYLDELSEDEAREKSRELTFIHRDFTTLTPSDFPDVNQGFDLIILPYNGLYCLPHEESQIQLINTMCQLLSPEGELWMDGYALPDPAQYTYESEEDYVPLTVIELPHLDGEPREIGVEELDRFSLSEQRLDIHYRYRAAPERSHLEPLHGIEEVIQHRYVYPWQLERLCTRADARLVEIYSDFDVLIQPSGHLKDLPWGSELEHWVAMVKPI